VLCWLQANIASARQEIPRGRNMEILGNLLLS
jgi:hypothetical protein